MSQSSKPERDPAEVYDELFVPALFAQWGPRVAEAAAIDLGQRVLDVGCGTGVLACAAARGWAWRVTSWGSTPMSRCSPSPAASLRA